MASKMDEMWADLENFNQIEVPMCLKVILWKCGYVTMLSLKYLSEKSIAEMEEHIQKYKSKIFSDENDIDECLYYYKKQDTFKFLPGHLNILFDLPQSIRKMQSEFSLHGNDSTNVIKNMDTLVETNNADLPPQYSVILNELINTANKNRNKPKQAYK